MEDRTTGKMWLVKHLEVIRQSVVEDMKVVKVRVMMIVIKFLSSNHFFGQSSEEG